MLRLFMAHQYNECVFCFALTDRDRYELREDRQREVARSIGHLEGLKYQLLSVLVPHLRQGQEGSSTRWVSSPLSAAPRSPQSPSNSIEPGGVASVPGLKALGAQIQALCEEVRAQSLI